MKKKRLILAESARAILLAALVSMFLVSCERANSQDADTVEEAPIYVHAQSPEIATMEEVIEVHGNLEPWARVEVIAETSGRIIELTAEEGDTVRAGQVMARLDDQEFKLNLQQAQSAYRVARSDYLSAKELFDQGMKSKLEYEKIRRSYQDAGSNLEMSKLRLSDTVIKCPIAGQVISKKVELYRTVGAMESLYTVADNRSFKISITVTEAEVAKIELGQQVRVRVDALAESADDFPLTGEVAKIQPQVDPQTGTVAIEVSLPNTDPRLRPGMFARLKIVTALHPEAMVIPRRALVSEESNHVWVVDGGGGARMIEVEVGLISERGVEIKSGLELSDRVIVDGQSALTSKSKIKIVEPAESISASEESP